MSTEMVCLHCRSNRVINSGKKWKCLDCHKSFKYGSRRSTDSKGDATRAMALIKAAAYNMYLMRDRINDDERFVESDIVKEE